jgi:TetR/AcrR family transcriptional regulator, transcriptional repressor of aconitase
VDIGIAPRPRLSRAETKEKTHRLLLGAAQDAFTRFGYQGATLDRIAAAAGFTKGAIYAHFRSKEALFLELLAEGMKQNAAEAEQILIQLARKPGQLDDALGAWFDRFDANNSVPLLALEMDLESRRNASFAALLDEVVGKQHEAVRRILTRFFGLVGREPLLPVEELAKTMIAVSRGMALARQTRHSAELTSAKVVRLLLGMPVIN